MSLTVLSSLMVVATADAYDDARLVFRDQSHDVVREPRGCPDTGCAAPDQGWNKPGADIIRFGADYAAELTLSTEVRGVARRVYFVWRIRAAGKDYYPAVIQRRGKLGVRFFDADFEAAACDGLSGEFDTETRVASVAVPPACFGAPPHVRVGAMVSMVRSHYYYYFIDDAQRERFNPRRVDGPKLSDRLNRVL